MAKKIIQSNGRLRFVLFEGMNNGPYRDDMSALWDWAPHDVAVLLDLVGELPVSVQAWGVKSLRPETELIDTAMVRLNFAGGTTGLMMVSWLMPEKRKKMTFICERDSVVFDDTAEQKVTLHKNMGPFFAKATKGKPALILKQEPVKSRPEYSTEAPLKLELEAFVKAVKTRTVPVAGLQHAVDSVHVLDAAERSIKLDGQVIKL